MHLQSHLVAESSRTHCRSRPRRVVCARVSVCDSVSQFIPTVQSNTPYRGRHVKRGDARSAPFHILSFLSCGFLNFELFVLSQSKQNTPPPFPRVCVYTPFECAAHTPFVWLARWSPGALRIAATPQRLTVVSRNRWCDDREQPRVRPLRTRAADSVLTFALTECVCFGCARARNIHVQFVGGQSGPVAGAFVRSLQNTAHRNKPAISNRTTHHRNT